MSLLGVSHHPDYIAACAYRSTISGQLAAVNRGIDSGVSGIAAYNTNKHGVSDEVFVEAALASLKADPTSGGIAEYLAAYQSLCAARIVLMQAELKAVKAVDQVHRRLVLAGHRPLVQKATS